MDKLNLSMGWVLWGWFWQSALCLFLAWPKYCHVEKTQCYCSLWRRHRLWCLCIGNWI